MEKGDISLNHKDLAAFSKLAYDEGLTNDSGVKYLIRTMDCCTVLAIAGTDFEWMDILRNLAVWPKSLGGIDTHTGYANAWNSIEDEIIRQLDLKPVRRPIIITGHSAGGGIALVAALQLIRNFYDVRAVVTFGAPKMGVWGDGSDLQDMTTQYAHSRDPVPSWLGYRYEHINRTYVGGSNSSHWFMKRMKYHRIGEYFKILPPKKVI